MFSKICQIYEEGYRRLPVELEDVMKANSEDGNFSLNGKDIEDPYLRNNSSYMGYIVLENRWVQFTLDNALLNFGIN